MQNASDFVVFIAGEWDAIFHRKPLFETLAKREEVKRIFIIEIPADLVVAGLRRQYRLLDAFYTFFNRKQRGTKIFLYRPMTILHQLLAIKIPLFRKINKWIMNYQLRRLFKIEKIDPNAFLWIYRPELFDWTFFSDQIRVVYDCYDEYGLDPNDNEKPDLIELEEQLFKHVNYVFVTTLKLLKKARTFNPKTFLIFNGANLKIFKRAFLEKPAKPDDLQNIPPPIVGYLGGIRNWIDFDLLNKAVQKHKDKSFVFVGPWINNVHDQVEKLNMFPNVYFLGKKSPEKVYQYLHFFDIAIIPNRMTLFNQSVVPIKLFEYLAAGKKVLTTDTSQDLKEFFSEYVLIADSPEDFAQKIDVLVNHDSNQCLKNFAFGQKQGWEHRVEEMMKILNERD
ncbi:MAG: glycosyltransferase family 1 protein [Calditrichaeota bacterium]|nr:glycosyltransferase family 1 protein [Calditrichota bacterium]